MREEDIPIDINYNKLLDWLIDRRHCNVKWQQSILPIKEKIKVCVENLKKEGKMMEINIELNNDLNYFHCQKVKQELERTGEGNKTMFGQYSSQKMKAWNDIIQMYEKGNVHLAEVSAELMRNVNYEIPSLKKQIAKCQQTQRDCTRKEGEFISNAATFKEKFYQSCKEVGIHGQDVKKELLNLVTEVPAIHRKIAEDVRELGDAVEYYEKFANFVVMSAFNTKDTITVSPLISFIISNGNATVHQWKTGEICADIPVDDLAEDKGDQEDTTINDDTEIDWGDIGNGVVDGPEATPGAITDIDWSSVDAVTECADTIDFGDGDNDIAEQIDWRGCIEIVDDSADVNAKNTVDAFDEKELPSDNTVDIAYDNNIRVLDCAKTRNCFLDELLELEAFLTQRLWEMNMDSDVISANQFQTAPVLLQLQTKEKVTAMLRKVQMVLDELNSKKMQNLYLLKNSERFVHRIGDALQQKMKIAENMLRQAKLVADRRRDALELQGECEPKLEEAIGKTKELQKQISAEISKWYKNRIVNIMGDINII